MKIRLLGFFIVNLLLAGVLVQPSFAIEHTQRDGLFSMTVPEGWHWEEGFQEVVVTFPDGKTMAIDIQMVPSRKISQDDIKKILKDGADRMIKEGVEAHNGVLIDNKEIKLNGVYATQIDFKSAPQNPLYVTYISLFNKGYAYTITYGSPDPKMHLMLDDIVASLKFR